MWWIQQETMITFFFVCVVCFLFTKLSGVCFMILDKIDRGSYAWSYFSVGEMLNLHQVISGG